MVVQPLSTSFGNYAFSNTYLGAVVVVFVWWLKLQLHMHSVPITTYVVSSSPDHDKVYSIQHNVIKVISDLRQVGGFLRVLRLPLLTKIIAMILLTYNIIVESGVKFHNHNASILLLTIKPQAV